MTDPAGASLVWTDYAPFGAIRSQGIAAGAVPSVYGFTGEYRDPTGLLHLLTASLYGHEPAGDGSAE